MKKTTVLLAFCILLNHAFAQTTGRIENLKDAWGTTFTYIGDIKNKKPNGLGIAIYSPGLTAIRYAGNFTEGQYSGKGTMLYTDGTFLTGNWKKGKMDGRGTLLNKEGNFYSGNFIEGKKEGAGVLVFADKGFVMGTMKDDTYEGRCIYIPSDGATIADNIYTAGKKNGSGYQYDLNLKKLYEGVWTNGDWQTAGTAAYASFLKNNNFYAEKSDDQIVIGGIDKNNKNVLQDTAFFMDIKKAVRYFGYCNKGFLTSGVIIKDSSRFIGTLNTDGAYGPGYFYKKGKFYDEGNYEKDHLQGANCLSIDLSNKTIYYGTVADKGYFTGKGWYVNNSNELYYGNFEKGKFTGAGYLLFKNGKTIKGTFNNAQTVTVTSLINENGATVNIKPKTFSEALSLVVDEFSDNYEVYKGEDRENYSDDFYAENKSIFNFPGSVGGDHIDEDFESYVTYTADYYQGDKFQLALNQYNKLCKNIAAAKIKFKNASITPSGTVEVPTEETTTFTKFTLPGSSLETLNIYAVLHYKDDAYTVSLVAGDKEIDDDY